MRHDQNIERIKVVYRGLAELKDHVVFVGGATVSFYADEPAYEIRETDDVDIIVEILNYGQHATLQQQVLNLGFSPDVNSKVRERYIFKDIRVDIMPTRDVAMGFENKWYAEGYKKSTPYKIDSKTTIRILTAPYFIATKLEAFKDRGSGDGRTSQDFEDIVYIFESREAVWDEMQQVDKELKGYLRREFRQLLDNPGIEEWIDCHVEQRSSPATYDIIDQMQEFVS